MKRNLFILAALLIAGIFVSETSHAAVVVPATDPVILPGKPDPSAVKSAIQDFKNLSKKEKKERIKEVKTLIKHYKAEKKSGSDASDNTVLLAILAILLPPLAVYLYEGEINNKFWISLLLTLLFWLPGVIYALVVILGAD
ncbi:MAG TPA: YqaE/Pmp3 family membrane protein [Chitinophagaceae bacterium]|nr:YqaE/Pmp3 family membrane protein [Chitinophagaceae bacterium]